MKHLVEEAKSQATLEGISKKNKKTSSAKDQQGTSTSQQGKSSNHSSYAARNGYITISPISFVGRLSRYVNAWREITYDPWVLEVIQNGLSLNFVSSPFQQKIPRNAAMNANQTKICNKEVLFLLEKGVITPVNSYAFISGFFLVPKASGGWRPIINLKALNFVIPHLHFKMEGVNTLRYAIRQGDWLAKVDLKDAYFSVALNPSQKKIFVLNGKGEHFNTFQCPLVSGRLPGFLRRF